MDETERFRSGTHACKPFRYGSRRRKPKNPPKKSVVLGLECALKRTPAPQDAGFDLTGVYECGGAGLTMCVNHAGDYVAVWISRFDTADTLHLVGRAEVQPNFLLFWPQQALAEDNSNLGAMGVPAQHQLILVLDNPVPIGAPKTITGTLTFERVSKRPTLSDRALESLPTSTEGDMLRVLHHSPIPVRDTKLIEDVLTSDKFRRLIDAFVSEEIGPGLNRQASEAAKAIQDHLERELRPVRGWRTGNAVLRTAYTQLAKLTLRSRVHATVRSASIGDRLHGGRDTVEEKPLYAWLVDVVAIVEHELVAKPNIDWLTRPDRLGIPSVKGAPEYKYDFAFVGEGIAADIGVGAQAFYGRLSVRQVEPTLAATPWTFEAFLVGGSGGPSAGAQVGKQMEGTGWSNRPWREEDFLTDFALHEAGVQASLAVGGAVGPTAWTLAGPPGKANMMVEFSKVSAHGVSAGAEFGVGRGYIMRLDDDYRDIIEPPAALTTLRYESRYEGSSDAPFDLGSAQLRRSGEHLLGLLAAAELALFMRADSHLELIGSADRVDVDWYNKLLSTTRAENVLQCLRDVLGSALKARTTATGLGEKLPTDAGLEDGTEAAEYRRVFVEYAGRPIVNLRVARK